MRGQGEACGGGQPSLRVEGGSGVRSEPAPDGVRARGLQAVCRVQEPAGQVPGARTVAGRAGAGGAHRRWPGRRRGRAPSLRRPLCAAAFPESPRRPCLLTQVHPGPQRAEGSPGGQPAAHGPPTPEHIHVPPVRSLAPSFWKLPDAFSPWGSALAGTEGP